MSWPRDLSFERMGDAIVRVTTPGSGALVGYLTRGYLRDAGATLAGGQRWYVAGHEYVAFSAPSDAAWALRDYHLGHVLRERVIRELRVNDGHEGVVLRMRNPRDERLAFKRAARRTRRRLLDELDTANAQGGVTWR